MIAKSKMPWVRMLFTITGTSIRDSRPRILAATMVATAITIIELYWNLERYTLTPAPFTVIGIAISIF